jgi:hypothetical protein
MSLVQLVHKADNRRKGEGGNVERWGEGSECGGIFRLRGFCYLDLVHRSEYARCKLCEDSKRSKRNNARHDKRPYCEFCRDPQHLLPRTTPTNASELWPVLSRCALLLAVVITVTTGSAVSTLAASTDASGALRANLLLVCYGNNLGGDVEPDNIPSTLSEITER